jgi:N-acetylmuramoyl-L-alanine amidase
MKKRLKTLLTFMLAICMACNIVIPADAANIKFKYEYNGKTKTYNGRSLKLTVAGENIDLTETPPIFTDDTSMFPYEEAFEDTDLKVKVAYDQVLQTITFVYYDKTVVVTIGSKTATVNGTSWTLPVAPMLITYKSNGESRIVVPAEAIALKLGLNYVYTKIDDTTGSILISEKDGIKIRYNGVKYNHTGTTATVYTKKKKISGNMPGLMLMNNVMVPAVQTYKKGSLDSTYSYEASTGKITIANEDHTVEMTINSNVAYVDGQEEELDCTPLKVKLLSNKKFYIMVPSNFVSTSLGYNYNYSSTDKEVVIGLENAISFPLPEGITFDQVVLSDGPERQVQVTIPGVHTELYENIDFTALDTVEEYMVETDEVDTYITLDTSIYRAAQLKEKAGAYQLHLVSPRTVYNRIVVIDAGHGGSDPGAMGNGLKEKDLTLKILKYCKKYFDKDETIKVYYSRTTDVFVNLYDIRQIPNEVEADMFVSIHIDSYNSTSTGTSVLYNGTLNQTNDGGLSSFILADRMINKVQKATGLIKRYGTGLSNRPNLVVLKANCPAVLIETGFISNPNDVAQVLGDNKKLKKVGKAIYKTVVAAFEDYPR